jgi:hypothetical protein
MTRAAPSPGVIAGGVSAILIEALSAACAVFVFYTTRRANSFGHDPNLPVYAKTLAEIICGFFFLAACFLIATGAGALQLRRWARISLLAFAGMMLFFGMIGIFVILFVVLGSDLPGLPTTKIAVVGALIPVYGIPVVLAGWWLMLFTRRGVVAQFEARRLEMPPARTIRFSKRGCPLAVSVVGWFLLSTVLSAVVLPFLPFPVPVILFGHMFEGSPATLLLIAQFGLIAVTSVGLLRLQRWSLPASVALQILYVANALFTFLSPHYVDQIRDIMKRMQIPPLPAGFPDFLPYTRYFAWIGLLAPIGCIVTLLYARKAFNAAADAVEDPQAVPAD